MRVSRIIPVSLVFSVLLCVPARGAPQTTIYYTPNTEGFLVDWLAISGLKYGFAYIGDCMNFDCFKDAGGETAIRPAAGEVVQRQRWRRFSSVTWANNANVVELGALRSPSFTMAACFAYVWSDRDIPDCQFWASSDDGLKVVLNGKVIFRNQIQRSPTVDSDRMPAPLKKGWNTLLCCVDQIAGGHLLVGRFVDKDGKCITDLKIVLDRPAKDGEPRFAAASEYNAKAGAAIKAADALRADGKLADAVSAYEKVVSDFPLSDVAPRALSAMAAVQCSEKAPSLKDAPAAAATLGKLRNDYGADPLAEYAILDLAALQAGPLGKPDEAMKTYAAFEAEYPKSNLLPTASLAAGKVLLKAGRLQEAVSAFRRTAMLFSKSDEVIEAVIFTGDALRAMKDEPAARKQFQAAIDMIDSWIDGRYAVDVSKQAWLRGLRDQVNDRLK